MANMSEIMQESKARIKLLNFGDEVTNICAGENNPMKHCFFVNYAPRTTKNRFGISHTSHTAKCTDKKGKFCNFGIEVIYPGHIDDERCKKLFKPVWEATFNK